MVGKVVEKNGLIVITWTKDGFTLTPDSARGTPRHPKDLSVAGVAST
ncbi:hypothetical protein [Glutamicibacter protophormiae]